MARDRRSETSGERTGEERERAREERERRRLARAGAAQPAQAAPPLPPPDVVESSAAEGNPPNEPVASEPRLPELGPLDLREPGFDRSDLGAMELDRVDMGSSGFDRSGLGAVELDRVDMGSSGPDRSGLGAVELDRVDMGSSGFDRSGLGAVELDRVDMGSSGLDRSDPGAPRPERVDSVAAEDISLRYPLPLPVSASNGGWRGMGSRRKHRTAQPLPHRPNLQRPHLHRPRISPVRTGAARVGALLGLVVVLGALAVGVVLLTRHTQRPKPAPAPAIVKVVIPEGYTRLQIAALAHADGLRGSYLSASKRSTELRPSRYGAPAATPNLEGFLFPATYEIYVGAPTSQLVAEQLAAFGENFGGAEVHRAKVLGVTPYELLIVASIIEREAAIPHDRPLVAAVIYNRLRLHMTLGVDSTLRYALHDFTHPLTEAELASDSPYNTRVHQGLPPTPISNPGLAAIQAAARPAKASYLYYVAGSDGCGEQVFSTSYAQFEKNVAAYREALSKNGGRVPTCKKK